MPIATPATHSLLPLGHELFRRAVPWLDALVRATVDEARGSALIEDTGTVPGLSLSKVPAFNAWMKSVFEVSVGETGDREQGKQFLKAVMPHLHYAINFELNHRKVFFVDESLAWMLSHTNLDIEGRALELPFPSFAIALQDEATLEVVRAHWMKAPTPVVGAVSIRSLTVYVARGSRTPDGVNLDLAFVADAGGQKSPLLFMRTLHVRPDDDLDTILESTASDVDVTPETFAARTPEHQRLVRLVLNAILYATSGAPEGGWPVLVAPSTAVMTKARGVGAKRQRRAATRAALLRDAHSSEATFHLPGKISISQFRALREAERHHDGGQLFSRFMVRGHWRHPPSNWTDQRLRWIEPYWKGPEMATIIEREYRMTL